MIAEGEGLSYWHDRSDLNANQFSVFTGRPTIVGWPNDHEWLWRGAFSSDAAAGAVLRRMSDVDLLYRTTNDGVAVALLRRYQVRYVFVGPFERATYYANNNGTGLGKFSTLLTPVFDRGAVTIFQVSARLNHFKAAPLPVSSPHVPVLPVMTATNLHVDPHSQDVGLKAGQVYMIVHLSVRNDAARPLDFALSNLRLQDLTSHNEYLPALDPSVLDTQLLPGTIDPGGELDGMWHSRCRLRCHMPRPMM